MARINGEWHTNFWHTPGDARRNVINALIKSGLSPEEARRQVIEKAGKADTPDKVSVEIRDLSLVGIFRRR